MAVALRVERVPADVATGPRERLIELMSRYERPLIGYLQLLVHDPETASDCAQDTFLRAYEHLERGRSINGQWVYKVARNRAIDHLRRNGRHESADGLDLVQAPEMSISSRTEQARDLLATLSAAESELLYLSAVDRFSSDEIGTMLGIRPGAVRVRLFRARERLRGISRGKP